MYIYSPHTSNRRYIWHQNSIPSYFYTLLFTISFLYWLWHWRCCDKHHTDDHLEDYPTPSGRVHYDWRIYTSSWILCANCMIRYSSLASCLQMLIFTCSKLELNPNRMITSVLPEESGSSRATERPALFLFFFKNERPALIRCVMWLEIAKISLEQNILIKSR